MADAWFVLESGRELAAGEVVLEVQGSTIDDENDSDVYLEDCDYNSDCQTVR